MLTPTVAPVAKNPITLSYLALRKLVGLIALALPFVLIIVWSFSGQKFPASISGYYYTGLRNIFEGALCAIATFQLACRGYDRRDEIAGILSGACAVGVALFPTKPEQPGTCDPLTPGAIAVGNVHLAFASALFLLLAYFCLFLFRMTAMGRTMTRRKVQRNKVYFVCGLIIVVSIAMILLFRLLNRTYLFGELGAMFTFETTALFAFGVAWLVKGETFLKDEQTPKSNPDEAMAVASD
jgi:hypothetical protein